MFGLLYFATGEGRKLKIIIFTLGVVYFEINIELLYISLTLMFRLCVAFLGSFSV